jgi:Plasmid encoded RepA protein
MRDWMERMGLAIGGETAHSLREQAARICACTLKFFWENDTHEGWARGAIVTSGARGAIVTSGLRFKVPEDSQGSLWEDRVVLDEVFWKALRDHPVPVLEERRCQDCASFGSRPASADPA